MKDTRPLSERFELSYVKQRHFADRWHAPITLAVCLCCAAVLGVMAATGDHAIYSSGDMTSSHAMFGVDCAKCHTADSARPGFWLPASDEACLACHTAPLHNEAQSEFVGRGMMLDGHPDSVTMSGDCAACHSEHQGHDYNLAAVPDSMCIRCHADLKTDGWREPSMQRDQQPTFAPSVPDAPVGERGGA